jgi:hypothetical protein
MQGVRSNIGGSIVHLPDWGDHSNPVGTKDGSHVSLNDEGEILGHGEGAEITS